MISIACPVCAGPVAINGSLQEDLEREASEALLSAVRALEDWITGARWLLTQPGPPPHLQFETDKAARHAEILREIIEARSHKLPLRRPTETADRPGTLPKPRPPRP